MVTPLPSRSLVIASVAATLLVILPNAYQSYIYNTPEAVLKSFVNSSFLTHYGSSLSDSSLAALWGFTVASSGIAAVFGAPIIPWLTDLIGTKHSTFVVGGILLTVGGLMELMAKYLNYFELFIVGQMIANGFVSAIGQPTAIVYMMECSPPRYRGALGSLNMVAYSIGILLASTFGLPEILGTARDWGIFMALSCFPSLLAVILSRWLPDSPKFLYHHRKDLVATETAIKTLYGGEYDMAEVIDGYQEEEKLSARHETLMEMAGKFHLQQPLILTIITGILSTVNGAPLMMSFSTSIFRQLHISNQIATKLTFVSCLPLPILAFISTVIVDRVGRRPLLLGTSIAQITAILGFTVLAAIQQYCNIESLPLAGCAAFLIVINMWFGQLGTMSICNFLFAELLPQFAVGKATSLFVVSCNLSFAIQSQIFPPLQAAVGCWAFALVNILPSLLCLYYLWRNLPETKVLPIHKVVSGWIPPNHSGYEDLDTQPLEDSLDNDDIDRVSTSLNGRTKYPQYNTV